MKASSAPFHIIKNGMRKKIVAGNWKMNTTFPEAEALTQTLLAGTDPDPGCDLVICPPFPYLVPLSDMVKNTLLKTGAQNCAAAGKGAYTGEVSAGMLVSAGASYVILGHSERRSYYHETDEVINAKVHLALNAGLIIIFCCGETLEERNAGRLEEVVSRQIREGLKELDASQVNRLVIAYEPVWAIGTGLTATPEQAQEAHAFIRGLLKELYGEEIADSISILYGGSCNASNAASLFAQPDIDGGLIGGASLSAADFLTIARSF